MQHVKIVIIYIIYWTSKKYAQNFWSKDLVHEKPFGHRVVHHGHLLTSCLGQNNQNTFQAIKIDINVLI